MFNNLKIFIYYFFILGFVIVILFIYTSQKNIIKIQSLEKNYNIILNNLISEIPFLSSDTIDIIEVKYDVELFKKRQIKRKFEELLNLK